MKEIQRKNILVLICFWLVGLTWISIFHKEKLAEMLPTPLYIALLIGLAVACLVVICYLIYYLSKGYEDFKNKGKSNKMADFLFSDVKTSFEYEDERTLQISELASHKSNAYSEFFLVVAILYLLFADIQSVPTSVIILTVLITLTIKQLSYISIWKKEFYR